MPRPGLFRLKDTLGSRDYQPSRKVDGGVNRQAFVEVVRKRRCNDLGRLKLVTAIPTTEAQRKCPHHDPSDGTLQGARPTCENPDLTARTAHEITALPSRAFGLRGRLFVAFAGVATFTVLGKRHRLLVLQEARRVARYRAGKNLPKS